MFYFITGYSLKCGYENNMVASNGTHSSNILIENLVVMSVNGRKYHAKTLLYRV